MASAFSHAAVAATIGAVSGRDAVNRRVLALGMVCAVLPDIDVIGFFFDIPYESLWGHRGLTHSLSFALLWSASLAWVSSRGEPAAITGGRFLYLFLCTASHGVLDALTDGGLGVAFLSPFDPARYFFPVRPIVVSPIGIGEFFSHWGLKVVMSELAWIWLPCGAVLVVLRVMRNVGQSES